jgi:hypothetical protein
VLSSRVATNCWLDLSVPMLHLNGHPTAGERRSHDARTLYVTKKLDWRNSRQAADLDKHFHLVLPQAALVVTSAQHHLPIVYAYRIFVNAGDLISLSGGDDRHQHLPIVILAFNYDPVVRGYVSNIARPIGNVTGPPENHIRARKPDCQPDSVWSKYSSEAGFPVSIFLC